uniref:Coactosin-like protein n=1 Tax=Arion vulgaris TaxID=1028688 RepID=A0A0B6YA28_9EUPU
MSTEVSFDDESSFTAAISDVRSDASDISYVICGHFDGNPNLIGVLYTGSDISEIGSKMDPTEAMYGLVRYETKFDMSTTIKFVYIHWIGENLPVGKKGRYGVIHGSIESRFSPYHLLVEASSPEDLDPSKILHTLMESAGTKSKVIESDQNSHRQMRGFTQTQLPQRDRKANFGVSAVSTKGAEVEILQEVFEAVSKVRSDVDPVMWMVAGYKDANPKGPLQCMGSGDGGLDELKRCLQDVLPMYGLFRVSHKDADDITTVKFVYIVWVGTSVKPMTKAKISTHKGTAEEVFCPAHVTLYASEISDIVERDIMEKIKSQAA